MRRSYAVISCAVLAVTAICGATTQASYASQHPDYENSPEKIPSDFVSQLLPHNQQGRFDKIPIRVESQYIHAFLVCDADFQKARLGSKADIRNYEGVYFWQDKKYYYVIFISRKLARKHKAGQQVLDGEMILGQDTRYLVRKSDFSIANRVFVNY